ncbi:hypothetical protein ACXPVS_14760 [Pseudomonas sp. Ma2-10]
MLDVHVARALWQQQTPVGIENEDRKCTVQEALLVGLQLPGSDAFFATVPVNEHE